MTEDPWEPDRYRRFASERARPGHDLLRLLDPTPGGFAVDLGCGTGDLTVQLATRLDASQVLGIDSSPAMLERADALTSSAVRFEAGDIGTWGGPDNSVDVVFSNASLHWIPGHDQVLTRWAEALRPGGQIAVQVPSNADHASHTTAAAVAAETEFASAFAPSGGPPPDPVAANVLRPEHYAERLFDLGFEEQDVRLGVYGPVLPHTADIVEWTRGSTLTRFRRVLSSEDFERFVTRYTEVLVETLGEESPHYFTFKRILLWGRLPA